MRRNPCRLLCLTLLAACDRGVSSPVNRIVPSEPYSVPAQPPASTPASAVATRADTPTPPPPLLPLDAYRARLLLLEKPPASAAPGDVLLLKVKVTNLSKYAYPAGTPADNPRGTVLLSYHVLVAADGSPVVHDGVRTPLGGPLLPGESRVISMKIVLPKQPGAYQIPVDLVHEAVTWFAQQKMIQGFSIRMVVRG